MAPQGQGMPPGGGVPNQQGRQQDGGLSQETSVQTEPQLMQNLITRLGMKENLDLTLTEIGDYMATGFLEDRELDLINDYQTDMKMQRSIKRMIGYNDGTTRMEGETVARMITISQSSKSKGGRGIQAVKTEIVQQLQDLYEKQELGQEEKGAIDKVMGALEGNQVVGETNPGNYRTQQNRGGTF